MAGVIGLRGPDIDKRDALRGYKVEWRDADRPIIRPHTGCPVLTVREGVAEVGRHVFGFSRRFTSFNARADKLQDGKMWSRMFGAGHGVAPVSYILEWADLGNGKRPYRIERADGSAMAVPALVGGYWEDRIDVWLRPERHDTEHLLACLVPGRNDEFVAYPLAADVGSARFDDEGKLEAAGPPVSWADLKDLPPVAEAEAAPKQPAGKTATKKATKKAPAKGSKTGTKKGGKQATL